MTIEEVVRKVLLDEHADVIREAVKAVAAEMMEVEVAELIGAQRGERRPADRSTHRHAYPTRRGATPAAGARIARRIATAIGRGVGTRGPASWSCRSLSSGRAATSRRFLSRASAQS